jgi:carbonic anhydrase
VPELFPVDSESDIPEALASTPIGDLLRFHNLGAAPKSYEKAELLVGTCIDNRIRLRLPDNFAFVLRDAGANLKPEDFAPAFVVGYAGVRHMALIAHTQCGMSGLAGRETAVVDGLETAGWSREDAAKHFSESVGECEIGDPAAFVFDEARRFRERHTGLTVEPLLYKIEDHRLYGIRA